MISSVRPSIRPSQFVRQYVLCDTVSQEQLLRSISVGVSYGSTQLKTLWSGSVDFLIFCDFSILTLTFLCYAISQKPLLGSTSN